MSILSRFIKKVVRATEEATEPDVVKSISVEQDTDGNTTFSWMPEDVSRDELFDMLAEAWQFLEEDVKAQALVDGKTVH